MIQPFPSRAAERERQRALAASCYYSATGSKKMLSILTLKSGWVVASPFLPDALVSRPTVAAPSRAAARGAGRDELTGANQIATVSSGEIHSVAANGHTTNHTNGKG